MQFKFETDLYIWVLDYYCLNSKFFHIELYRKDRKDRKDMIDISQYFVGSSLFANEHNQIGNQATNYADSRIYNREAINYFNKMLRLQVFA